MNDTHYRRETCRMCLSRDLEKVVKLDPTPVASHYVSAEQLEDSQIEFSIDLFLCPKCGYVGMVDVVHGDVLFGDNTEITSMSLGLVEHLRLFADTVLDDTAIPEGSLVIDIGSNDGTLLKFFQDRGMKVIGVDPSSFIAEIANDSGITTVNEFFTSSLAQTVRSEHGPAKIIVANRVIANIDDLTDMIEGVRHLLAPDGTFYFETGYLVDILDNLLFDTIYHEHLGYDLVRPLASLFPRHGLELVDVERIGIKGGSLRCKVRHGNGQSNLTPAVSELIAIEDGLGLHHAGGYKLFNDSLTAEKQALNTILSDIQAKDLSIAGYGASVGSTTQIFYFGLGNVLSFLVDDDPRHRLLFSPGHHIPVYPSQTLYERRPDYVLILAWRYAEPIMKKHQEYLDQGGHFIIPLPTLKVM